MSEKGNLTLSRKLNESITITTSFGETIEVTLKHIGESQVKLTIEANRDVSVLRKELI